jgi:hypothetical protein
MTKRRKEIGNEKVRKIKWDNAGSISMFCKYFGDMCKQVSKQASLPVGQAVS